MSPHRRHHTAHACALALSIVATCGGALAHAQQGSVARAAAAPLASPELRARADRMQHALEQLAAGNDPVKVRSTIIDLLAGGGLLGYGAWVALAGDSLGDSGHRTALSGFSMMLGGLLFAEGVRGVVGFDTTDEQRLSRFARERAAGALDALALARFEGELRAEAALAAQIRVMNGVAFVGTASAGAALLAFALSSQLHDGARTAAYFWGGALVATGVWQAISNLCGESDSERAWRQYQQGEPAHAAARARLRLGADLGPGAAALSIAGRF